MVLMLPAVLLVSYTMLLFIQIGFVDGLNSAVGVCSFYPYNIACIVGYAFSVRNKSDDVVISVRCCQYCRVLALNAILLIVRLRFVCVVNYAVIIAIDAYSIADSSCNVANGANVVCDVFSKSIAIIDVADSLHYVADSPNVGVDDLNDFVGSVSLLL